MGTPSKPPATAQPRYVWVLVALLFCLLTVQVTASAAQKSITFDEKEQIVGGYYMLRTGTYYFNSIHPVVLQLWLGLPLLALDLKMPAVPELTNPPERLDFPAQLSFTGAFLEANADKIDQIALLSRFMNTLLAIILGIYVFRLANQLFGWQAGLFSLFLYVLDPNILTHAGVSTLDMGFSLLVFLMVFYGIRFLQRPSWKYLIINGIVLGLTLAAKVNAPIMVGLYGIFFVVAIIGKTPIWSALGKRVPVNRLGSGISVIAWGIVAGLIALVTINVIYRFDGTFLPVERYLDVLTNRDDSIEMTPEKAARDARIRNLLSPVLNVPIPLPNWYVQVTGAQVFSNEGGRSTFLLGEFSDSGRGWWYYHALTLLFKTPIPILLCFVMWLVYQVGFNRGRQFTLAETVILLSLLYLFVIVSVGNVKIGLRHILPVIPLLYVLLASLATIKFGKYLRSAQVTGVVLAAWLLLTSAITFPNYLAYFNELAGGPANGYRVLVDSNLDWGQELKALANWQRESGVSPVNFIYFGSVAPSLYGVNAVGVPIPASPYDTCPRLSGIVAASVTFLQYYPNCFGWILDYEPIARLNHSIFIYDLG